MLDEASGDLYLGELNPRITGVTPLSTQAARDLGLPPLLVLQLLEWQDWQDAPGPDVAELSRAFRELQGARAWSQLIIKGSQNQPPSDTVPASGIWAIDAAGEAGLVRSVFDTGALAGDHEAMVLRTIGPETRATRAP